MTDPQHTPPREGALMDDVPPVTGTPARVTINAVQGDDGIVYLLAGGALVPLCLKDSPAIVSVEPASALPDAVGTRIRATVICNCGDTGSGVLVPDVELVLTTMPSWWGVRLDVSPSPLPCGCFMLHLPGSGGRDLILNHVVIPEP